MPLLNSYICVGQEAKEEKDKREKSHRATNSLAFVRKIQCPLPPSLSLSLLVVSRAAIFKEILRAPPKSTISASFSLYLTAICWPFITRRGPAALPLPLPTTCPYVSLSVRAFTSRLLISLPPLPSSSFSYVKIGGHEVKRILTRLVRMEGGYAKLYCVLKRLVDKKFSSTTVSPRFLV